MQTAPSWYTMTTFRKEGCELDYLNDNWIGSISSGAQQLQIPYLRNVACNNVYHDRYSGQVEWTTREWLGGRKGAFGSFYFFNPENSVKVCIYKEPNCYGDWYEVPPSYSCQSPRFDGRFSIAIADRNDNCANREHLTDYRSQTEIDIDNEKRAEGEHKYKTDKPQREFQAAVKEFYEDYKKQHPNGNPGGYVRFGDEVNDKSKGVKEGPKLEEVGEADSQKLQQAENGKQVPGQDQLQNQKDLNAVIENTEANVEKLKGDQKAEEILVSTLNQQVDQLNQHDETIS